MRPCPRCGEENEERARFCWSCGALLEERRATAEERKVVSVLFVDLVGFTARSDAADPEDVRATLRTYHDRLKREIERFGGTVEKFVGDAVMAVFGAPVAHEDDAERAVRAALRIAQAIEELNEDRPGLELAIRAAVNTGEAVVTLGARPEAGEGFVTGDVVNVASRLQAVAPVGGVVVGELTYRSTTDQIAYEALEPVVVKGKGRPLALWCALEARSRFGVDVEQRTRVPLIGRDHDLNLLKELFGRVVREQTVQLVTVVGAGRREEPTRMGAPAVRRRSPRHRSLATGAMPPVRRGHHVLGSRRGREVAGRHPGERHSRGGGREAQHGRLVRRDGGRA